MRAAPESLKSPGPATAARATAWPSVAALGAVVAAGAAALVLRSPHTPGSWGVCPSQMLGFACPGCGGLRGTYELLHGDIAAAWAYNPLVLILVPAVLALLARWAGDAVRGRPAWAPSPRAALALGIALLAFGVARNVPAWMDVLGPLGQP